MRIGGTGTERITAILEDIFGNIILQGYVQGGSDLNGDNDFLDDAEDSTGFDGIDAFIMYGF